MDNEFCSQMKRFLSSYSIQYPLSSANFPQGNSFAEAGVRSFRLHLEQLSQLSDLWDTQMLHKAYIHNTTANFEGIISPTNYIRTIKKFYSQASLFHPLNYHKTHRELFSFIWEQKILRKEDVPFTGQKFSAGDLVYFH